ncbi:MAG: hypothetical protein JNJ60_11140 [Rhodocyclaceae bacterium]|nr:hypothetical protein [Rhodocyclaceae bacterium]
MNIAVEWRHLRASLLSAAVLALAGAATLAYALHARTGAETQLQAARDALLRARQTLAGARDEAELQKRRIAQFEALRARRLVGPEQRVEWLELLQSLGAARHLAELRFDLGTQHPIEAEWVDPDAGQLQIMVSTMRLDFPLDHEMLMFDLLQDLAAHAPALVRTRNCLLRRDGESLRGECRIDWISWQVRHA